MKNTSQGLPLLLFLFFAALALGLWGLTGKGFYLFNFLYIGTVVSAGIGLAQAGNRYSRHLIQLGVGGYMLLWLGLVQRENMQLEGFLAYLFLGVFEAGVIHYLVAKIAGPLLFGRGWCGYACWTAMVLDLLPYPVPGSPRHPRLGFLRRVVLAASVLLVAMLTASGMGPEDPRLFQMFLIGNGLYYLLGILLAFHFKDNRAFCKYLCPITVFLKPASYFAYLRVRVDARRCTGCGQCLKHCPMEVDLLNPKRQRKNGTECILCMRCASVCPVNAVSLLPIRKG